MSQGRSRSSTAGTTATSNNLVGPPFSLFHATGGTDETTVEGVGEGPREKEKGRKVKRWPTREETHETMPLHSVNRRNRMWNTRAIHERALVTNDLLRVSTKKKSLRSDKYSWNSFEITIIVLRRTFVFGETREIDFLCERDWHPRDVAKISLNLTSCAGNWLRTVTSDQNRIQ